MIHKNQKCFILSVILSIKVITQNFIDSEPRKKHWKTKKQKYKNILTKFFNNYFSEKCITFEENF